MHEPESHMRLLVLEKQHTSIVLVQLFMCIILPCVILIYSHNIILFSELANIQLLFSNVKYNF